MSQRMMISMFKRYKLHVLPWYEGVNLFPKHVDSITVGFDEAEFFDSIISTRVHRGLSRDALSKFEWRRGRHGGTLLARAASNTSPLSVHRTCTSHWCLERKRQRQAEVKNGILPS